MGWTHNKGIRGGFTLIELLVVIIIAVILISLVVGGMRGTSYYQQTQTGVYQCVKTYTYTSGSEDSTHTSKRLDVRPLDGGPVETFVCDDDLIAGIHNSATLYAQFQVGGWYEIETIGRRREGFYSYFPMVKSVQEVEVELEGT